VYKIEKTIYGVKLIFGGFIKKDEMSQWVYESDRLVASLPAKFGVFVDMRDLKPLSKDTEMEMQRGQKLYKQNGMERSVVVLNDLITTMQFKRIAKETGIYQWERYLDASSVKSWEEVGVKWLVNGIDPDLGKSIKSCL